MSDRVVSVTKAQRLMPGDDPVPGVVIRIVEEIRADACIHDCDRHDVDAKALADALGAALPGGTMDRLVVRMLERKVSELVVSRDDLDRRGRGDGDELPRYVKSGDPIEVQHVSGASWEPAIYVDLVDHRRDWHVVQLASGSRVMMPARLIRTKQIGSREAEATSGDLVGR